MELKYKESELYFTYYSKSNCRYVLGKRGKNSIIFFGINPSTAKIDNKGNIVKDQTIKRIENITKLNGYDSWIMLNIYPQRTKNPNDLDIILNENMHKQNLKLIKLYTKKESKIVASWGCNIKKRKYLTEILKEIIKTTNLKNNIWFCNGFTENDDPKHPSRISKTEEKLIEFKINEYIK